MHRHRPTHRVQKKEYTAVFSAYLHTFNKFRHSVIIFDMSHPETSFQ